MEPQDEMEISVKEIQGMSLSQLRGVARVAGVSNYKKMAREDLACQLVSLFLSEEELQDPQDEVPDIYGWKPRSTSNVQSEDALPKPAWLLKLEEAIANAFEEGWVISNEDGIVMRCTTFDYHGHESVATWTVGH